MNKERVIELVNYINTRIIHKKDVNSLNKHEKFMFDTLCSRDTHPNLNLSTNSNSNYFEFDSKYVTNAHLIRINRWAFEFGQRMCFVPARKMGRRNGITRAYLQNTAALQQHDIERTYGKDFLRLVQYTCLIEASEFVHLLNKKFQKELKVIEDKIQKPIVQIPEEVKAEEIVEVEENKSSEIKIDYSNPVVNIDFTSMVKEDIIVTIHTLSSLGLLDDNLRAKLNDKIIESLFETDIVECILNSSK